MSTSNGAPGTVKVQPVYNHWPVMSRKEKCHAWLMDGDNLLLVLTIVGVLLGALLGFLLRLADLSDEAIMLISFPGNLLMNMLKCIIIPMIIASIMSSLVQMDTRTSGRMGAFTLLYYICTTTLAVITSLAVVMIIKPGVIARDMNEHPVVGNETDTGDAQQSRQTLDMLLDFFRNLIPENIFGALLRSVQTTYETDAQNNTLKTQEYVDSPNVLGIVSFSIIFGLAVAALPKEGESVAHFFLSINECIVVMVSRIMWALPLGVIFLVAGSILELQQDLGALLSTLGVYVGTTMCALTIHFWLVLPLLYFLVCRKNPYKFLWKQSPAYANVLGHSSSSAALPITMSCLQRRNKVDARVAEFCLPVGAAINIDGAALYEGLAAVFVGQLNGMEIGWGWALAIIVTVTLSSVGSSGLPGAGLVSVLPIIAPIPITNANVAILIVVDWFVDRYRTANNVMGDSIGAGVVNQLCSTQLKERHSTAAHPMEEQESLKSATTTDSNHVPGEHDNVRL